MRQHWRSLVNVQYHCYRERKSSVSEGLKDYMETVVNPVREIHQEPPEEIMTDKSLFQVRKP